MRPREKIFQLLLQEPTTICPSLSALFPAFGYLNWKEVLVIAVTLRRAGVEMELSAKEVLLRSIIADSNLPISDTEEVAISKVMREDLGCSEEFWDLASGEFQWHQQCPLTLWSCAELHVLSSPPEHFLLKLYQDTCAALFFGDRPLAAKNLMAILAIEHHLQQRTAEPELSSLFAAQAEKYLRTTIGPFPSYEVSWCLSMLTPDFSR